jgi:hypothetical protein
MKNVSRLTQPGDYYAGGLDYGWKNDPMTVIIVSSDKNTINCLDELHIDNQGRYSHEQLALRIVKWIKVQAIIDPALLKGIIFFCDKSNQTFIEMLNKTSKAMKLEWLIFKRSVQMEVLFRTNFKKWLMSYGKLNISLLCKWFWHELQVASWDERSSKPKLLKNCPDHMMDAFDYALTKWYGSLLGSANPYYFKKEEYEREEL